jgi:hypothetical protein
MQMNRVRTEPAGTKRWKSAGRAASSRHTESSLEHHSAPGDDETRL